MSSEWDRKVRRKIRRETQKHMDLGTRQHEDKRKRREKYKCCGKVQYDPEDSDGDCD